MLSACPVQDGEHPYPSIRSNPEVMKMVCTEGAVHPQPSGCSPAVYAQLAECWSFDPAARPEFAALELFFEEAAAAQTEAATTVGSHEHSLARLAAAPDTGSGQDGTPQGAYGVWTPIDDEPAIQETPFPSGSTAAGTNMYLEGAALQELLGPAFESRAPAAPAPTRPTNRRRHPKREVPKIYSGGSAPGIPPTEYLPVGNKTYPGTKPTAAALRHASAGSASGSGGADGGDGIGAEEDRYAGGLFNQDDDFVPPVQRVSPAVLPRSIGAATTAVDELEYMVPDGVGALATLASAFGDAHDDDSDVDL